MLGVILSLLFSGGFDIGYVYFELSMDTYQHGMDASPLVKTVGGARPHIDSLSGPYLYGRLKGRPMVWDSLGNCISTRCKKKDNLTWSEYWVDVPE